MKKLKFKILYTLAIGIASSAHAGPFTMRAPITDDISPSVWVDISTTKGDWINVEGNRNCNAWTPSTSKVLLNENFIQSRDCKQLRTQEVTAEQKDSVSGKTRTYKYTNESYFTDNETRDAVGTMSSWVFVASDFTEWEYTGEESFSNWAPESSLSIQEDYTQTRAYYTYKERYEQFMQEFNETGEIRKFGNPVLRSGYDKENEQSRDVSVIKGEWEYPGDYYNCDGWVNVTSGSYFQRKRTCVWDNTRKWEHESNGEIVYSAEEKRVPSGTVYQYVQTYNCPNAGAPGYVNPWGGCSAR